MDDTEGRRSEEAGRPEPPRPGSTPAEPERPNPDEGPSSAEEDETGPGDGTGEWVPM